MQVLAAVPATRDRYSSKYAREYMGAQASVALAPSALAPQDFLFKQVGARGRALDRLLSEARLGAPRCAPFGGARVARYFFSLCRR